mmetsp:Transcript_2004/g.2877  ORF Transcript_2004/g.2877 Transcript_2004/m.2877 type:complete len:515 (+) Transcript_2004:85-1629(+)
MEDPSIKALKKKRERRGGMTPQKTIRKMTPKKTIQHQITPKKKKRTPRKRTPKKTTITPKKKIFYPARTPKITTPPKKKRTPTRRRSTPGKTLTKRTPYKQEEEEEEEEQTRRRRSAVSPLARRVTTRIENQKDKQKRRKHTPSKRALSAKKKPMLQPLSRIEDDETFEDTSLKISRRLEELEREEDYFDEKTLKITKRLEALKERNRTTIMKTQRKTTTKRTTATITTPTTEKQIDTIVSKDVQQYAIRKNKSLNQHRTNNILLASDILKQLTSKDRRSRKTKTMEKKNIEHADYDEEKIEEMEREQSIRNKVQSNNERMRQIQTIDKHLLKKKDKQSSVLSGSQRLNYPTSIVTSPLNTSTSALSPRRDFTSRNTRRKTPKRKMTPTNKRYSNVEPRYLNKTPKKERTTTHSFQPKTNENYKHVEARVFEATNTSKDHLNTSVYTFKPKINESHVASKFKESQEAYIKKTREAARQKTPPPPPKKIYEKVYTVELISNLPKPETIAVTSRKF